LRWKIDIRELNSKIKTPDQKKEVDFFFCSKNFFEKNSQLDFCWWWKKITLTFCGIKLEKDFMKRKVFCQRTCPNQMFWEKLKDKEFWKKFLRIFLFQSSTPAKKKIPKRFFFKIIRNQSWVEKNCWFFFNFSHSVFFIDEIFFWEFGIFMNKNDMRGFLEIFQNELDQSGSYSKC